MVERTEYPNGTIIHSDENGKYHMEDGPAVTCQDGREEWWLNGKLHREDGPALIYPDGSRYWWLNGREYSFKEWLQELNITDEEKMELMLYYG